MLSGTQSWIEQFDPEGHGAIGLGPVEDVSQVSASYGNPHLQIL